MSFKLAASAIFLNTAFIYMYIDFARFMAQILFESYLLSFILILLLSQYWQRLKSEIFAFLGPLNLIALLLCFLAVWEEMGALTLVKTRNYQIDCNDQPYGCSFRVFSLAIALFVGLIFSAKYRRRSLPWTFTGASLVFMFIITSSIEHWLNLSYYGLNAPFSPQLYLFSSLTWWLPTLGAVILLGIIFMVWKSRQGVKISSLE